MAIAKKILNLIIARPVTITATMYVISVASYNQ